MVRSPHGHARIVRIDTAAALASPGVLAVLRGADLVADGLKAMSHRPVPTNPHEVPLKSPDGSPFFVADPLPLPVDRARFVGEPVAMVVAETALGARDGAERVIVDWEPLPAVVTSTDAVAAGGVASDVASPRRASPRLPTPALGTRSPPPPPVHQDGPYCSRARTLPLSRLAGHHQPARQPRPLASAPGESYPLLPGGLGRRVRAFWNAYPRLTPPTGAPFSPLPWSAPSCPRTFPRSA
jgi:Aldehyde oxidase and xanthine dehydrogenase, a/b hammerhead domain